MRLLHFYFNTFATQCTYSRVNNFSLLRSLLKFTAVFLVIVVVVVVDSRISSPSTLVPATDLVISLARVDRQKTFKVRTESDPSILLSEHVLINTS